MSLSTWPPSSGGASPSNFSLFSSSAFRSMTSCFTDYRFELPLASRRVGDGCQSGDRQAMAGRASVTLVWPGTVMPEAHPQMFSCSDHRVDDDIDPLAIVSHAHFQQSCARQPTTMLALETTIADYQTPQSNPMQPIQYNQTLNNPNNRWIIGNASVDMDVY